LDGSKTTAANIGTGYFAEAIRASFMAVGGDPSKLDIRLASSYYAKNPMQYWETVMTVLKHTSKARLERSISIMGREKSGEVDAAKLMYPAMQVADIFYQEIDIAHAGMDQRKAHVVMRDVADKVQPDKLKPIVLHHSLLMGLDAAIENKVVDELLASPGRVKEKGFLEEVRKMSKSKPDSAIFVHDSEVEISRKIKKAFCPEKGAEGNPVLNWTRHVLFWNRTTPFRIERKEEHGGAVEFTSYQDLESAYAAGDVHPMDLKNAVAGELIELLAPVREHFGKPDIAAMKAELDKVLANR
jgi:tyrosyl-tRNA synthetase